MGTGSCSVTWGSLAEGDWAEPMGDGPPGAPIPVRNRRTLLRSRVWRSGVAAPASRAQGWGSSKMAPEPSCWAPEYPRENQPPPVHSLPSVSTLRAASARSWAAKAASPLASATSASTG